MISAIYMCLAFCSTSVVVMACTGPAILTKTQPYTCECCASTAAIMHLDIIAVIIAACSFHHEASASCQCVFSLMQM